MITLFVQTVSRLHLNVSRKVILLIVGVIVDFQFLGGGCGCMTQLFLWCLRWEQNMN